MRELITSGLLLDAFACAYELDGLPSAADELADEVTEIGRDRNEIGRDCDEIAQPAAEVPEEAAHGGTEATEGARAPGTTRVAKTAPAAWAHTATLNHVATLCDAVEAACDDKGETCGMMGGPWRRALACRLTRLLHQAGRKAWWLHAPDAPCSTTPPARCCELVCLLRVAGDLAMQKEAPFGPPAVEIGDVAAFRAPSEGPEAAGDAADDATSAAPESAGSACCSSRCSRDSRATATTARSASSRRCSSASRSSSRSRAISADSTAAACGIRT